MEVMPMDYCSQIELPIAANHEKSPIRKQEFDQHSGGELHIQNDGLPGQMLVMTAIGPRMMTPKLQCACGGAHYGCDCRIVFDDHPPISGNPRDVIQVACGLNATHFLLRNGEVWNCGSNDYTQLGRAVSSGHWQTSNLGQVTGLPPIPAVHIAATNTRLFVLLANGEVWFCGDGSGWSTLHQHVLFTGVSIKNIVCGKDFVYFLSHNGNVWSCGNNSLGQLGRVGVPSPIITISNLGQVAISNVKKIACGDATTYFQVGDYEVWTCGQNSSNQCGFVYDGNPVATPRLAYTAPYTSSVGIRMISCGTRHGLIVLDDGQLLGTGYPGQYAYPMSGSGSQNFVNTGLQVTSGIPAKTTFAVAGDELSWLRADQLLLRGGNNIQGQLSPGAPTPTFGLGIFNMFPFDQNADNIVNVRSKSSFIIRADGNVFALGDNTFGQLGCTSAVQIGGFGTLDFH